MGDWRPKWPSNKGENDVEPVDWGIMVYFQTKPDMLSKQWKGPETLSIEAWHLYFDVHQRMCCAECVEAKWLRAQGCLAELPCKSTRVRPTLWNGTHTHGEWFTVPQEKAPLRIVLACFGYTVVIICYNSQLTTHNHVYPYVLMFRTDFPGIQHI
jgi:hypothetical protein